MSNEITSTFLTVGTHRGYLARPTSARTSQPFSAMLLLPMITGIGERVREFAQDIAAHTGAVALSWDPWHGKSSDDTPLAELQDLRNALDDETALNEQRDLLNYLEFQYDIRRAGVIGWCLGGRFALMLAAREPRITTVIPYHPTLPSEKPPNHTVDAISSAKNITAPVMLHYPGQDSIVPHENFHRLQTVLQSRAAETATIIHLYPDAKHGFSDNAHHDDPANIDAWNLSWPQTLEFIKSTS